MQTKDDIKKQNINYILENYNLYNILGVASNSSLQEIKKAYHKKALIFHPDKGGDKKKFFALNVAYKVLSDPDKRKEYNLKYGIKEEIRKRTVEEVKEMRKEVEKPRVEMEIKSSFNGEKDKKKFNKIFSEKKDLESDYIYDIDEGNVEEKSMSDFLKSSAEINSYLGTVPNIFRGSYFDGQIFNEVYNDVKEPEKVSKDLVCFNQVSSLTKTNNAKINGEGKLERQGSDIAKEYTDVNEKLRSINIQDYKERERTHVMKDSAYSSREMNSKMNELQFMRNNMPKPSIVDLEEAFFQEWNR